MAEGMADSVKRRRREGIVVCVGSTIKVPRTYFDGNNDNDDPKYSDCLDGEMEFLMGTVTAVYPGRRVQVYGKSTVQIKPYRCQMT